MSEHAGAVEFLSFELLDSAVAIGALSSFSRQLFEASKHGAGVELNQLSKILASLSRDKAKLYKESGKILLKAVNSLGTKFSLSAGL